MSKKYNAGVSAALKGAEVAKLCTHSPRSSALRESDVKCLQLGAGMLVRSLIVQFCFLLLIKYFINPLIYSFTTCSLLFYQQTGYLE